MTRDERVQVGLVVSSLPDEAERQRLAQTVVLESVLDVSSARLARLTSSPMPGPWDEIADAEAPPLKVRPRVVIVTLMIRPSRRRGTVPGRRLRRRSGGG